MCPLEVPMWWAATPASLFCDIRIAESSTGLLAGPELHASGPERPTDGLPLYSALGPLPCDMLRLRGMVAAATRLQAELGLDR